MTCSSKFGRHRIHKLTEPYRSFLHHGWRKFWYFDFLNALKWLVCNCFTFTMVKENFEISPSKMPQNGPLFNWFRHNYLHHGWRKYWEFISWNAPEYLSIRLLFSVRIISISLAWCRWTMNRRREVEERRLTGSFSLLVQKSMENCCPTKENKPMSSCTHRDSTWVWLWFHTMNWSWINLHRVAPL